MRPLLHFAVACFAVGCGGGSGSSGPPGDPNTGDTHAVRVQLSNVRGAGLALRNNAVDTLEISPAAAGTATFATRIAAGSRYAVRVARQPANPSQTCTVTSAGAGTGVVGAADVVVDVACTTDGFAVGGSVSNLTASGLVLGMAGQPDVTIDPGAVQFTFPTSVESGSAYDVRIVGQPAPQRCVVLRGSGAIGGADVSDVRVACDPVALSQIDVPGGQQVVAGGAIGLVADLAPPGATDTALTWSVCAARPTDAATCTPAPAATHGSVTSAGRYSAPATVPASPYPVYVQACQGTICGSSTVEVHAGPAIDSFAVTPQTINWDDHAGVVTVSWSVRDATSLLVTYPSQPAGVDVTGQTTFQIPWSQGGNFTLVARNAAMPLDATRTLTVWVSPLSATPLETSVQGYLSPDGRTLICDVDVAYENAGGERASFSGFKLSADGGQTFGAVTPLPWALPGFEATRWLWTYFGAPGQSFTHATEEYYTVPSNPTVFTLRRSVTCRP